MGRDASLEDVPQVTNSAVMMNAAMAALREALVAANNWVRIK